MSASTLLQSAANDLSVPESVLGTIPKRDLLLRKFGRYRQFITLTLILLYVLAIVVAIGTVVLALRSAAPSKGFVPYIGGAAFVALLEFARRLTKDWMLMTLPLAVAEHLSNDELNTFIQNLLRGIGKNESKDKS